MTNTAVLTRTHKEVIKGALRLIGAIDANQPLDGAKLSNGLSALSDMVKAFQNQGLHLWVNVEGILFTDVGKTSYNLGPSGDEACNDDDFISTELSVAGVATNLTITVDSTTGMLVSDKIGIRLDDNTRQWTTIKSINSTTNVITLSNALTGAAAIDNSVFTFTNLIARPLSVLQLRRDTIGSDGDGDDIESDKWSRDEYFAQPNKTSQGDMVNWYYSPKLSDGRLYVWQTSNDVDKVARFTYSRPLEISEDADDNIDFPAEWFEMLKFNLASRLAYEFKTPRAKRIDLKVEADLMLEDALGFDTEDDSMSLQPDMGG